MKIQEDISTIGFNDFYRTILLKPFNLILTSRQRGKENSKRNQLLHNRWLFLFLWLFLIPLVSTGQEEILINGEPCGMHGSAKEGRMEFRQNVFKNRFSFPKVDDFLPNVTLSQFVDGSATADKFTQSKAVEVTGFVFEVKKGGIETCNCKTSNTVFRDAHIELTLSDQQTGKEDRFVVEVTPRIRQIMESQGIDWSTSSLKQAMEGRMVRIQGWLFYDSSHITENFADDPNDDIGRKNWRATSWEIHPVTSIEILDPEEGMPVSINTNGFERMDISAPADLPVAIRNGMPAPSSGGMDKTPLDMLIIVVLGAILGMVGQGLRVVVGLKKVGDDAASQGKETRTLIQGQQIVISLLIAFAIGAIAGVLAAIGSTETEFTRTTVFAFVAAGYAGTDFIEGFIRKNPSVKKQ